MEWPVDSSKLREAAPSEATDPSVSQVNVFLRSQLGVEAKAQPVLRSCQKLFSQTKDAFLVEVMIEYVDGEVDKHFAVFDAEKEWEKAKKKSGIGSFFDNQIGVKPVCIEPADRESKKAALKAFKILWTNSKIANVLLVNAYKLMPFLCN